MHKTCIFCGGGSSNEHIISKWLIRDCRLDDEKVELGFGVEKPQGFDTVNQRQSLWKFLLSDICAACNNGWMSRLENKAKAALTPFLQEEWPVLDLEALAALPPHCHSLALWILKTAVTFGEKMTTKIPDYIRQGLPKGVIPPGVVVDLAFSEFPMTYVAIMKQWNVMQDGKVEVRQSEDSFKFTLQIRHLILRVSYFPYTARIQMAPRYPVVLYPIFKVLPEFSPQHESCILVQRKRYQYSSVKQFEDETLYVKTDSLDPVLERLGFKL